MCGRYVSTTKASDLEPEFEATSTPSATALVASWNVAPTDRVLMVAESQRSECEPNRHRPRQLDGVRWGLIPRWAKDLRVGARMINARAETLTTKTVYRDAAATRRCLIPAAGWYEWRPLEDASGKQAYFMTPLDGPVVAFAGVYESWIRHQDGESIDSCSIITTAAIGQLSYVHDRMPLVIPRGSWDAWLDPDRTDPTPLLTPATEIPDQIEIRPVGRAVGNVRNNSPDLIAHQSE